MAVAPPASWRLRKQRLRMEGSNCFECGEVHFPPRPVCPDCNSSTVRRERPGGHREGVFTVGKERER